MRAMCGRRLWERRGRAGQTAGDERDERRLQPRPSGPLFFTLSLSLSLSLSLFLSLSAPIARIYAFLSSLRSRTRPRNFFLFFCLKATPGTCSSYFLFFSLLTQFLLDTWGTIFMFCKLTSVLRSC